MRAIIKIKASGEKLGSVYTLDFLVSRVKRFFKNSGKKKAVVGLSGGVDSALTCFLLSKALGSKNVFALHLPYFKNDEAEANARKVARLCRVSLKKIPIRKMVDSIAGGLKCDKTRKGNLMARVRMALLYDFAKKHDALVAGTGNRSELSVGYFTKYGDGGVDFLPIGRLLKGDARKLALEAGIPPEIVFQPPTAGLWPGQTDEGELQMLYSELDQIIELLAKGEKSKAVREFGKSKVKRVELLEQKSAHKRLSPEVL